MTYPNNEEVRAWADARFYDVPARGKLPAWVVEEWDKAHPKRKYVHSEAHHGTLGGTTQHGCTCLKCVRRRRSYFNERNAALRAA